MSLVNATSTLLFPTNATFIAYNSTAQPTQAGGSKNTGQITCAQIRIMCMMALQAMQPLKPTQPSNTNDTSTNSNGTLTNSNDTSTNFNDTSSKNNDTASDFNDTLFYVNRTVNDFTTMSPTLTSLFNVNTTLKTTTMRKQQMLPRVCVVYQSHCMRATFSDHVLRLGITFGTFGMLACLLNMFVIFRICQQNLKRIHQSKLYFLSMAFADMYFGFCCFIYSLMQHKVITYERTPENLNILRKWWEISIHVTFCASLFHVVMVTADRFMATTFPLVHKICMTRKKIFAIIFFLWLLSVIVSLMPYWLDSPTFSSWFSSLTVIFGSILLIVTYFHISTVAIKRRKTLKRLSRNKANFKKNVKSINTTLLSTSITFSFIACNLFGAVFQFRHLLFGFRAEIIITFIELMLLTINAMVNPIFYTIVELFHNRMRKRGGTLSENSQSRDRKVTTCSVIDRQTRSMESIATVDSRI